MPAVEFLVFICFLGSLAGDRIRLLPFTSTNFDIDDVSLNSVIFSLLIVLYCSAIQ